MSRFSERFRLLRKERGLSQAALATALGFTKSSVNMYHVVLQPENPSYEPLVYFGEAMSTVRILGKAVGFTSIIP